MGMALSVEENGSSSVEFVIDLRTKCMFQFRRKEIGMVLCKVKEVERVIQEGNVREL
jgi:hypothetical protein